VNHAADETRHHDRGAVLPLVLLFVLVLGLVLAGLARYTTTNLRYSAVVQDRSAAAAAAEAGVRYAIQRVDANAVTTCNSGPVAIVPTHDVALAPVLAEADAIEIDCSRLDTGGTTLSAWAAVVTGEGVSGTDFEVEDRGHHAATGRIFLPSLRQIDFRINSDDVEFAGNLFYDGSADGCATIERYDKSSATWDDDIVLTNSGQFVCWPQAWDDVVDPPPIDPRVSDPALPTPSPSGTDFQFWGSTTPCRVFEPGRYTSLDLALGGYNYFRSGVYVFDGASIDTGPTSGTVVLGGYPRDERFQNRLITGTPCAPAQALDGNQTVPADHGVTWYFRGGSEFWIRQSATVELLPMLHDDGVRQHAVSIQVVDDVAGGTIDVDPSGPRNSALIQGQIWSPDGRVDLRTLDGDGEGQVTSGVVAAQLLADSTSVHGTVLDGAGSLGPDRTIADHELLLSATATVDGVTVEARAVVEHRPAATAGNRVAVRSIRIID